MSDYDKIEISDLKYLLDNIHEINYFIKRVPPFGVGKTGFYNIKSALVLYLINAVREGIYTEDEATYEFIDLSVNPLVETDDKIVLIKFTIGGEVYTMHQIVRDELQELISKELKQLHLPVGVFKRAEDDREALSSETLYQIWVNIVNKCEELNWVIFKQFNFLSWKTRILARYEGLHMKKCRKNKKCWTLYTGEKKNPTRTRKCPVSILRSEISNIIRSEFSDLVKIKY